MSTTHGLNTHTHTHTRLMAPCPGLPGWASTRKVKPIWILLEQEPVSGSGISWAICKSAPRSRQITTPEPHRSVFYRPDALPATQPTASKHWRHGLNTQNKSKFSNNVSEDGQWWAATDHVRQTVPGARTCQCSLVCVHVCWTQPRTVLNG